MGLLKSAGVGLGYFADTKYCSGLYNDGSKQHYHLISSVITGPLQELIMAASAIISIKFNFFIIFIFKKKVIHIKMKIKWLQSSR
jgi:hypothetical protein